MFWRWTIFFSTVIWSLTIECYAQTKDTIMLYNGQVLVGEIKGCKLGELTIDDDDIGVLEVKQYKITVIKSYRRLKIETNEKIFYFGVLGQSSKPGFVVLKLEDGHEMELEIGEIASITVLRKKFISQLDGTLSAGFSYAKSSNLGQLNISSVTKYETKSFQYLLDVDLLGSIDSSKFSRDREDAGFVMSYTFNRSSWIAAAGIGYQRNLELSLARRYQQFFGGGNKLFLEKYWQLVALSGITLNQEKNTSGVSSGTLYEVPVIFRFDYYRYSHPNIQVTCGQSIFFGLTQKGRFRYDGFLNFSCQVIHHFYLTINPYANYDNEPSQGSSHFDFGTAISLSYRY